MKSLQCTTCKHLSDDLSVLQCKAFPHGVPDAIIYGTHDHREPYPGDHGIQYEPDAEEAAYLAQQKEKGKNA